MRSGLVLLIALVSCSSALAQNDTRSAQRGPRIAIVPVRAEATQTLADLASAELSSATDLILLERSALTRLLNEQKLSLSGLVDANLAVQAGRILSVNLFATIEPSVDAKGSRGIVVFDVATGLRLADQIFDAADDASRARQAAAAVRTAAERWRDGLAQRSAVSLFTVRNADLPRSFDAFGTALGAMLERQLLSGNVAVLERKRLDKVNQERNLTNSGDYRELLASLTLLDLQLSRSPSGKGIRASVALRSSDGKELQRIEETVEDLNGTGLLGPLTAKILAKLKVAPADLRGDRQKEARRFFAEAQLLWKHKHYEAGLQTAEAAFALDPADDARFLLSEYQLGVATEWLQPGSMRTLSGGSKRLEVSGDKLRDALGLGQRALDLIERGNTPTGLPAIHVGDTQRFYFNRLSEVQVTPADPDATDALHEFQMACLDSHLRRVRALGANAASDAAALTRMYGAINYERIGFLAYTPAILLRTHAELAKLLLDKANGHKAEKMPLPLARKIGEHLLYLVRPYQHKQRPDEPASYQAILEQATTAHHPLIRLYAKFAQQRFLVETGQITRREALERQPALLQEAKTYIDEPPVTGKDLELRQELYQFLNTAIGSAYYYEQGRQVTSDYLDACEFMLVRNDVHSDLVRAAVGYGSAKVDLEYGQRSLAVLERALKLLESRALRVRPDSTESFKFYMKEAKQKILFERPELARTEVVWDRLTTIVEAGDLPKALMILRPVVHEEWIYFFTGHTAYDFATRERASGCSLRFYRIPLSGGKAVQLGEYALESPPPATSNSVFWAFGFLHAHTLHRDTLYLSTKEGILAFPLAGGKPRRYTEKDGFPTVNAERMAVVDGHLIAGLEGGFIVALDLQSDSVATLASSRRNEKLSPFDNGPPFKVVEMCADPARGRVLFSLGADIWEYRPGTKQFTAIRPTDKSWSKNPPVWGPLQDDRLYLLWSDYFGFHKTSVGYWDLTENRYVGLIGADAARDATLPANFAGSFRQRVVHRSWVWQPYPFGRHSFDRKQEQYFPGIVKTYSGFSASEGMTVIGPEQILLSSRDGIYLMTLKQ